jgi:hypothetical protein
MCLSRVTLLSRGGVIAEIEARCSLEDFRRFLVRATFPGKPPAELLEDNSIFLERGGSGPIYVEADFKEKIRDIDAFRKLVKATNVLGIQYVSSSRNTELIWRQISGKYGRLSGRATVHTLMNLKNAGIKFYLRKARFV